MPIVSPLDDELSPADRQRLDRAISDAVYPITLERLRDGHPTPDRVGRTALIVARTRAQALAGRDTLGALGRSDLIGEWQVHRFQQDVALTAYAANGVDPLAMVTTWIGLLGEDTDVPAAAASLPFTSTHGRERSLVDLLARTPVCHDAAKALLIRGARGVSAQALTSAIHHRREDLVDLLLNAGAPANGPEQPQALYDLPLSITGRRSPEDDPAQVQAFNERCWNDLVAWGADVNRRVHGQSLLVAAIGRRDAAHVRWLIDHGANLNETWTIPQIGTAPRPMTIVDLLDRWAEETHDQPRSNDLQHVLAIRGPLRQAHQDQRAMQDIVHPVTPARPVLAPSRPRR